MYRRLRLFGVTAALLAGGVLAFRALPAFMARQLARTLSGVFQRPVAVGQVELHLFPVEIEVTDLRVGGEGPGAPPFLEVPKALVLPSVAPLRFGRIVLSRVRLERPRIYIHSYPEGGDNIPKTAPRSAEGPGRELSIGRLVLHDGELVLEHDRVPLELDLPDFEGRLTARSPRGLQGKLSFGEGSLKFGQAPALPLATEVALRIEGPVVTAETGRITARGTDLLWRGQIRFGAQTLGQFTVDGGVDLDTLDRHVIRSGFHLGGAGHFEGTVTVEGPRFRIDGRMQGTNGRFDGNPIEAFGGQLAWSSDGLSLRRLELQALGGASTLDIEVPSGPGRAVKIAGPVQGADAEGMIRAIFKYGPLELGAAATGEIQLEWPKGKTREISGRIALDLVEREDGRSPLAGRFEWRAEHGVETVERADLRTPAARVRATGAIDAQDRTDLAVELDSPNLASADDLLLRIRRALGNGEAVPTRFSGQGSFRGRWKGTLEAPRFEGRWSGREVAYAGVNWGKAEWTGVIDESSVHSQSLDLARGDAVIHLAGLFETGYFGGDDALDLRVRLERWPAEDIAKALAWDLDLAGPVTGTATVRGRRSRPDGQADLVARAGRYYGVAFDEARIATTWQGPVTRVTSGRASVGGGSLLFRGAATEEGYYDGEAELRDVEAAALAPASPQAAALGGRLAGRLVLQGTLDRPRLRGSLKAARLFVGDEGLGALDATFVAGGDGRIAVDATCRSPRVDLALKGQVAALPPYESDLRLEVKDTSLDPFLRTIAPALPAGLGITTTARLTLRGPLRETKALSGAIEAQTLALDFPDYPVRNREPVRLALRDGNLEVGSLVLIGEGTDLELQGQASVLPEGALSLNAKGTADLRAMAALTRRIRGAGAARVAVSLTGTGTSPKAEGRLTLEGAGLRLRGFPHGVEDAHGTIRFTESALEIEGLKGTLAGGEVEVEGRATYADGRITSFDLRPVATDVALRYPEGLRTVLDADIRAFGDEDRQWVTGSVDVKQALYRRRYDVASELLATRTVPEGTPALGEAVRFDLKVRAPGTLRVDNNLANLQARADLTLQGTATEPVLVGRAEVDRGRLYFQGQTYVIRRGVIDFTNPRKIDPLFDIEAETRIRSYRVNLKLGGTLARVTPTLTSDPPLSAVQILNLMAGADESVVTSLTEAQAGQAQLAATGAATLAAGRISEQVGLERGVERVFGLNRFSIDPSIVRGGAGTTTSARLTVGKRLNPDLSVIYSQDLRGTEERILSVEYILSDRLSLLLTREQPGGFGFDLRLRRTQR